MAHDLLTGEWIDEFYGNDEFYGGHEQPHSHMDDATEGLHIEPKRRRQRWDWKTESAKPVGDEYQSIPDTSVTDDIGRLLLKADGRAAKYLLSMVVAGEIGQIDDIPADMIQIPRPQDYVADWAA
ncbi:MAG TPA: hypothetical protein VLG47_06235 [Candidatus Saccharimonadales bacterium]|nr:hypothetical protein [Candidatus Saccharimonadales bacterium]